MALNATVIADLEKRVALVEKMVQVALDPKTVQRAKEDLASVYFEANTSFVGDPIDWDSAEEGMILELLIRMELLHRGLSLL